MLQMDHFLSITNSRNIFTQFETFLPNESVGKSNLSVLVGLDPGRGQLFTNNDKKTKFYILLTQRGRFQVFGFCCRTFLSLQLHKIKVCPRLKKRFTRKGLHSQKLDDPAAAHYVKKTNERRWEIFFIEDVLTQKIDPKVYFE